MELDERDPDREQRVAQRNAGVREGRRIEQNEVDLLRAGRVDAPDQLVLGVALVGIERVTCCLGEAFQPGLDVGQRRAAVELRLAGAEQTEVWAVQQQQSRHLGSFRQITGKFTRFRRSWRPILVVSAYITPATRARASSSVVRPASRSATTARKSSSCS